MESWSVTVATGALGPVLAKLTALLGNDYKLLEESMGDVEYIKAMLEPVHSHLLWTWDQQEDDDPADASNQQPSWMIQIRELSYEMDDHIDDFMFSLEAIDGTFAQQVNNNMGPSLRRLKSQVEEIVGHRSLLPTTPSRNKAALDDPRPRSLINKDTSELVGMEKQEEELIKFLVGEEECHAASVQEKRTICITGFAGMGKTTLASLVYQEIGEEFQCRAFVSLTPNVDMTAALYVILREVSNGALSPATEEVYDQCLVTDIANSLADKRYLIIIDDIWHVEDWEVINSCLPMNDMGSRIIITTRSNAIAAKCQEDNRAIIYKIVGLPMDTAVDLSRRMILDLHPREYFGREEIEMTCCSIAHICGGMPLGVIFLSLAVEELFYRNCTTPILDLILGQFHNSQCLKPLIESMSLSYNVLPLHLKTCLMHCSIHHKSDWIERDQLTRIWIAEGFVDNVEKANGYFTELVNRGLIWRCTSGSRTLRLAGGKHIEIRNYEINPLMLHFLKCKSQEYNLVTCWEHGSRSESSSSNPKRIHRPSVPGYQEQSMDVSHTHSLVVFDKQSEQFERLRVTRIPFNLKHFTRLRVLDLSYFFVQNSDLVDICQLLWLRHLGLKGTAISEVPREIGRLHHLKILDVRYTQVRELPWEVGQIAESLHVLAGDKESTDGMEIPEGVRRTWKDEALSSWLTKWSGHLSIMLFDRFDVSWEPVRVARSKIATRHMNLPQWVKQHLSDVSTLDIGIRELDEDDLKFLQEMPHLQVLALTFGLLPRRLIAISGSGFSMLQSFYVDCRLPRVTFQPGAMPKLRHLDFKFYAGIPSSDEPMGITHLCSLQKIVFRRSRWYRSDAPDISTTIAVVRKEATEHRNRITLFFF